MSLLFLAAAVGLALLLQRAAVARDAEQLRISHRAGRLLVESGESFPLEVTVENPGRRFVPFLRVEEQQIFPMEGAAEKDGVYRRSFSLWLRPRQRLTRSIRATLPQRGRYVLWDLSLYSGDFLGLEEKKTRCGGFAEVVAAPKALPSPALTKVLGGFLGDVSARRFILEDPVLTLGYREYTGREPMKMISWSQSARGRGLMVKKQDYTLEPSVAVLLNTETAEPEREEALERCFSLCRSVCEELEKQGVKYSFLSNAAVAGGVKGSAEGLGQRHFYGILEELGRATYSRRMTLEELLEKESRRQSSAGRILITPGGEVFNSPAFHRLRESAAGQVLILRGTEAALW